jgi:hypothetical protein
MARSSLARLTPFQVVDLLRNWKLGETFNFIIVIAAPTSDLAMKLEEPWQYFEDLVDWLSVGRQLLVVSLIVLYTAPIHAHWVAAFLRCGRHWK